MKPLNKDEISIVRLKSSKILTKEEHLIIGGWLNALGVRPHRNEIKNGKLCGIFKKNKILDIYYNMYLKYYKVKKHSKRYKLATKLIKYIEENQ